MRNAQLLAMLGALPALGMMEGLVPSGKEAEFGTVGNRSSFGYEFGADGSLLPTANNMQLALQAKTTRRREAILNPNANSTAKIQRYVFGLSQVLTLATPLTFNLTNKPRTQFRAQRVASNAPFEGFVNFSNIQVANVGVLVGGSMDAFDFDPQGGGQCVDWPTIGPQNDISIDGAYTGRVAAAAPFLAGSFEFTVSFKGPATMAGG